MSITFYSMGKLCGYCIKAEELLKPQIASGEIVKKDASEAPGGLFTGFPAFNSPKTGKTHMGLPESYEALAKKLGHVVENYHPQQQDRPQPQPRHHQAQCQGVGIL
jgi:hypothetical protein